MTSLFFLLAYICAYSAWILPTIGADDGDGSFKRRALFDELLTALSPLTDNVPIINKGSSVLSSIATDPNAVEACRALEGQLSTHAKVLYVGSLGYIASADHYFATSAQAPSCVVRPVTAEDLSATMATIARRRVAFAISGGKHTGNPGWSSTSGVHVDMRQFNNVDLSKDGSYVDIGAGLVWDDVYAALQGTGRTVLGGRTSGVGVGGFMNGGGGYSYLANQYGLCIESIVQMDVVLPDGTIVVASDQQNADLFWAIKGGGNQFGVFFNVRLRTFPEPKDHIWGGTRFYINKVDEAKKATIAFFEQNKDPKAVIVPTFEWFAHVPIFGAIAFYDGKEPPEGTFSMFNDDSSFGSWGPTTREELVQSQLSNLTQNLRGRFHTVSLERYTPGILDVMTETGNRLAGELARSGVLFSFVPENAMVGYGRGYSDRVGPFPFGQSQQPMSFLFQWLSPLDDEYYLEQIKLLAESIRQQAILEGQNPDALALYPNYALADTPAERLYGQNNVLRLRSIKAKYDPHHVMRLASSFDF